MNDPWRIEWHDSLPSTMDRAAELATKGAAAGTVVVARFQSEGRGTRGRTWIAPPDTCLMFSFILRPNITPGLLERLPSLVAQRLAAFLRHQFGVDARRKAPNDVLVDGKKICGILCTSRVQGDTVEWVTCGIGLNTTMSEVELPTPTATSLTLECVDVPTHEVLLPMVLESLRPLLVTDVLGVVAFGHCDSDE